jgi:hypothetical protein
VAGNGETLAPYWQRLGIERPSPAPLVGQPGTKLLHLLVVALIEYGGPAPLDVLAARLAELGVGSASGDLPLSLKKAWHGLPPIVREPNGWLALDLASPELQPLLFSLNLRGPRAVVAPLPDTAPPPARDVDEPLSEEEVEAAFRDAHLSAWSSVRQAAALLDAVGRPMPLFEVEGRLASFTAHRARLRADALRWWPTDLVRQTGEGLLVLNRDSDGLRPMRRAVRKLAQRTLVARWRSQAEESAWREREHKLAQVAIDEVRAALKLRHAVVHVAPAEGAIGAATLIDVATRGITSWWGEGIEQLSAAIGTYDVVAALDPRGTLRRLGLEPDRWRLADLRPPQKTKRLNRAGRALTLTASLIITSTTGLTRPLSDPVLLAGQVARNDSARVLRRLESDAKALFALYQYGRLHRSVRLRWGFLDEDLPVTWATAADRHVSDLLREAGATGRPVDLVLGAAPAWTEPWSRARRGRVVSLSLWEAGISFEDSHETTVSLCDIQAVRFATVSEGAPPEPRGKVLPWPSTA